MSDATIPHDGAPARPRAGRLAVPADAPVFFDAVLTPNRSLPPAGFYLIIGVIGGITLGVGTVFFFMGAWPVIGIAGLELIGVYWMFRQSYKTGQCHERLVLTEDALLVERADHRGNVGHMHLPATWLTVRIDDPVRHESQLTLSTHGVTVTVGSFLAPFERGELAKALQTALDEARTPPHLR